MSLPIYYKRSLLSIIHFLYEWYKLIYNTRSHFSFSSHNDIHLFIMIQSHSNTINVRVNKQIKDGHEKNNLCRCVWMLLLTQHFLKVIITNLKSCYCWYMPAKQPDFFLFIPILPLCISIHSKSCTPSDFISNNDSNGASLKTTNKNKLENM